MTEKKNNGRVRVLDRTKTGAEMERIAQGLHDSFSRKGLLKPHILDQEPAGEIRVTYGYMAEQVIRPEDLPN